MAWPDEPQLGLPAGCGLLRREPAEQGIPDRCWREGRVSVRWRGEGVSCRPCGREGTRSFKKLSGYDGGRVFAGPRADEWFQANRAAIKLEFSESP